MRAKRAKADDPNWELYFAFLDNLRESGVTNTYGAPQFLQEEFPSMNCEKAVTITVAWMKSFEGRTPRSRS
jgi:hypothetical protein